MPARRRAARRAVPRPAASRGASPVPPRIRPARGRLPEEEPHAHIVCRICGRIQPLELAELDRHLLTELAAGRPEGWTVERIAFSLAGACQRCREGPSAP